MAATFSGLPSVGGSSLGTAPPLNPSHPHLHSPSASPHSRNPLLDPHSPLHRASLGFTPFSSKNGPNHLYPHSTPRQWLPSLINSTQHIAVRAILVRLRSDHFTPLLQTLPRLLPLGESAESSLPRCGALQSTHPGRSRKESGLLSYL